MYNALLSVLLSASLLAAQANMVANPGFEDGFNGEMGTSWGNNTFGTSTVSFSIDSVTPHSGRYAQKVTCTSITDGAVQLTNTTGFRVLKSRAYQPSTWLKGDVPGKVDLILRKWGPPYTYYCQKSFSITSEWREYSFIDYSYGSDEDARFFITFSSGGTLYIDDAACEMILTEFAVPAAAIPDTLFGNHMHRAWYKTPWPNASFKIWRLWDAYATWDQLERVKGTWDFSKIDTYFRLAAEHDVDLIMSIAHSPIWASARPTEPGPYGPGVSAEPADSNDWINYVRTVGQYCKDNGNNKARIFEIWNEPSFDSGSFFSGTQEKLIELSRQAYTILKGIDPAFRVVSSSIVGNPELFDEYFGKGAGEWCDIVGYHFYTSTPERALMPISRVKASMAKYGISDKPLWNTEAGWDLWSETIPNGISLQDAGDYILRNFILNWATGVGSWCFYSWDNNRMGPLEMVWDGTDWAAGAEKPYMAQGYRTAYSWLVGATMTSCRLDTATATWIVELTRDGLPQMIVWNPDTVVEFTLPPDRAFTTLQNIAGTDSFIAGAAHITVNSSPVLLKDPANAATGINCKPETFKINVRPNPSSGKTIINFNAPQAEIRIFDSRGRLVDNLGLVHHSGTWNASKMANGLYFAALRIFGKTYIQKILKVK